MKKIFNIMLISFSILFLLASCAAPKPTTKVRISVLPIIESLPVFVAEKQGYFKEQGIEVELISAGSAPERDQLMQAGQIEGMVNEITSTILLNRDEQRAVVVRFARTVTNGPAFRILASKQSGITTVPELRGVEIGVSDGTVIEYITDRILSKAGFQEDEINKISVPKINERLALLQSGELQAACLPDPLASVAIEAGAVNVVDDTFYPEISYSVWTFDAQYVKKNPETVRSFLIAIEKAIKDINADKNKWNPLMVEQKLLPEPLSGKFIYPDMPLASVPSEEQFTDALGWLITKGLLENDVTYVDTVDGSLLPK